MKIAYTNGSGLRVATRTGAGSFATQVVDSIASLPAVGIDDLGRVQVAYVGATTGDGPLKHAFLAAGSSAWQVSEVLGPTTSTPSLETDKHGAVHIAFLDQAYVSGVAGRPRHAYRCFYP